MKRVSSEVDARIVQQYLAGGSQSEIAKAEMKNVGWIHRVLVRNFIPLRSASTEMSKGGKMNLEAKARGGRTSGRKSVENGHLAAIRPLAIVAIKSSEKVKTNAAIIGKKYGAQNSAVLARWRTENPHLARRLATQNGKINGRMASENGQLALARLQIPFYETKPELAVKAKLDELVAMKAISGYEHPYNLNNKFFVDFYVPDFNTMIEVDGCYWHKCAECGFGDGTRDQFRDAYIKANGYKLEIIREHEL